MKQPKLIAQPLKHTDEDLEQAASKGRAEGYRDGQSQTLSFLADLVGMAYNTGLNNGCMAEQCGEPLYMRATDNGGDR